jgi:hypothetical protein
MAGVSVGKAYEQLPSLGELLALEQIDRARCGIAPFSIRA